MRILFRSLAGLLLLWVTASLAAQDREVRISGEFRDVPFMEFVGSVESQSEVYFYFREDWVRGIRVSAQGRDMSLEEILDRVLLPAGLSWYMDTGGAVYLSDKGTYRKELPDFSGKKAVAVREGRDPGRDLTDAERRYMNGRKSGMLETIQIGREDAGSGSGSAVIHGRITDGETGEALIGATIYFEELGKGAATDVDGMFSMVVPRGSYTVDFNCMGMENRRAYLDVLSGGNLDISMSRSLIALNEVTVEASRYHNVKGTQMGFDRLNYKVLKEVPVVMGEKDILKVIQMLPGVQSVGEGSAGFNVRGGAADQNMIYVNRVPVYNINHMFGFFTAFSPDIVREFTLYKSNLPASFGGRLSSFFDISTRQGNMNQFTARGGISPITGHIALEGPVKKEKSSFVLSARTTYSDWILKRLEDPQLRNSNASFGDYSGVFTWKPDDLTLVKAFAYYSTDRFTLGRTNRYAYSNRGASLTVRRRFSSRLSTDIALVYGNYNFSTVDENIPPESYEHAYEIGHYEARADFTWLSLGRHRVSYGFSAIFYDLNRGMVSPYGPYSYRKPVDLGTENGLEGALYLADEITLLPGLTLYAGLRYSGFASLGPGTMLSYEEGMPRLPAYISDTLRFGSGEFSSYYHGPEPRVSLNIMTGENASVKASYNRVRQYLFMLTNTIAVSPSDQWKLVDGHIKPPRVDQLSLGYYLDFPGKQVSTSVEVYHKWLENVSEYRDGTDFISSPYVEMLTLQGEQKAYGAELMIRKNGGRLNGWLAYSHSRSFMHVDSDIPGESINGGKVYPSNYDRPHNLNLVSTYKLNRRLSFSANLVYITGRPATYPLSIYYMDGMEYIDYSDRNAYRIPDYFRMDLSINLEGNLRERKLFHSYWMLNFYNLTGRRNAYSVYFQNEAGEVKGYKLSIFGQPVITLSWNFKLGNYESE